MDKTQQRDRAESLRRLHHVGTPLVLPNAWDAASARAVVAAGFAAVATTSGGVAASLGWPDGEQVPADEMFAAVGRIAAAVEVPVTADIEAGYGLAPDEVARRLIETGAVGCNFEDTDHRGGALVSPAGQAERIAAIKDAARSAGVDIVLNARIDVFVRPVDGDRVELALERAGRYRKAGADCVYPIAAEEDALSAFIGRFDGPVNGMARPGLVRLSRLREMGLARISFGSGLHRVATAGLTRALASIASGGDDWAS